jgi:hypothetical protein
MVTIYYSVIREINSNLRQSNLKFIFLCYSMYIFITHTHTHTHIYINTHVLISKLIITII